jgi:PAS domain S-box-containing protein
MADQDQTSRGATEGELFRLLVENVQDYAIFVLDPEGRVRTWNPGAERLLGHAEGEIVGRSADTFFTPEDVRAGVPREEMRQAREEGRGEDDRWHVRKDGRRFWAGGTMTPLREGDGTLRGFAMIMRDRTDWKLAQVRERFQGRLLDAVGQAVIATDPGGTILYWNRFAETLYGWPSADTVGRNIMEVVVPETGVADADAIMSRLREGLSWSGEFVVRRRDGTTFPAQVTNTPLFDHRGKLEAIIGVSNDTTDRRRAEQRTRIVLESITDAFFAVDREWRFTYVNGAAERLLDRTPGDLIGKVIWEQYPGLVGSEFERTYRRVAAGRASESRTDYYPDHDRWYEGHVYPATDGISIYFRDVSEQKRAEEEVARLTQASERQRRTYETALSNTADFNYVFDREGRFTYVNQALLALWGRDLAGAVGKTFAELDYPPALAERLQGQIRQVAETGRPLTDETPYTSAAGERMYEYIFVPVLGAGGAAEAVVGSTRDITDRKRAEEQLREAERRWRGLAESLPQLVWTDTPDGQCDYLSAQWAAYTGIPVEEMLGFAWLDRVLHPDDRARTLACWLAAVQDKGVYDLEYRIRRHDGQYRWFKTRGVPIRDDAGGIVKWFGTCTDIEDQKQSQEALRESDRRFRQLADAMPQIVWTARPGGEVDYMNRRWHEFTGLPESAGNAAWTQILHPDDARPSSERWAASLRDGSRFEMEIRLLDRLTRSYRWHLFRTVAVRDEAGAVARWYGTATDIDAQKRAEESSRYLAEASAALAGVVDYESTLQKVANLAVPYFADWAAVDVANDEGGLRRLAVAHRDADKIAQAHQLMRQYPPDPAAPGGTAAVLRTGKPQIVSDITDEMLVRGAKDERHLALIRSLGLRSYICVPLVVAGTPFGVLTFATAESGRRYADADLALAADLANRAGVAVENTRLYQSLRDADRRKDEFLATLAHELRNPLAPIRNSLQILKMPRVDAKTVERSREMMERQVHHLVRLVDDLLDVSRVMRGKIELRKEAVELATVVARAVETAQPLIDAQRHQLGVSLPDESLPLDADPVRLAQVVGNLLTNAAKYTEPNGHIWLTARREGGEAVLRVRDDGIGIAPEVLPHVFDLFVQVDHAATRSQGGLGIGLTLVKNLVGMHRGTVEARSAGLGRGCEFVVRLPLTARKHGGPGEADGGECPRSRPSPTPGLRLLVVDDNRDAADSLAVLLRLQGHEVRVVHDGAAAMTVAPSYRPDVVFLDLGMPGMDGYEVARRLRKTPGLEKTVLAALTGWGQQEDRRRTAEAGFDHHLVKPPEPKAVEGLLADLKR